MDILKISSYGDIFPNNILNAKLKYKELAKKWHPDVNGGNEDVFNHITKLYNEAISDIKKGTFKASNYIEIKTLDKTIQMHYLACLDFDFGKYYICNNNIVYIFNSGTDKFFNNAIDIINKIKYQDENMKNMFKNFMPDIHSTYKTIDGNNVLVLKTKKNIYPLSLVLKHFNNKMETKSSCWIISRLSNIACFLESSSIVHNSLSVDNIFIEPDTHSVYIYGGWWFSGIKNTKMIGVNSEIYNIMPVLIKNSKKYGTETDLESIKTNSNIPEEIITFITDGCSDNAIKEYQKWDRLLDAAYGTRQFIEMNLTNKQIYN